MKKRTLLTFAATSAVVMTTAASYATWDDLSDTKTATITTGKGITVTSSELNFTGGTLADSANGTAEIEADLTISVEGASDTTNKKLVFTTSGMKLGDTANENAVIVKVMEDTTDVTSGDEAVAATNTYKVKVSLPAETDSTAYANKKIEFSLTAELRSK